MGAGPYPEGGVHGGLDMGSLQLNHSLPHARHLLGQRSILCCYLLGMLLCLHSHHQSDARVSGWLG